MQQKIKAKTRGELFVERVAWNAAAGAALAVMVLLLLCSLHWLDQFAAQSAADGASVTPIQLARPVASAGDRSPEVTTVNRPSG